MGRGIDLFVTLIWFATLILTVYLAGERDKHRIQEYIEQHEWMFVGTTYVRIGSRSANIYKAWYLDKDNQLHEALFIANFFKKAVFISEEKLIRYEMKEEKNASLPLSTPLDNEMKLLREKVQNLEKNKK